jgi:hypothetical protein
MGSHVVLLLTLLHVLPLLALAAAPSVPAWLSMFNPDFDAAGQHSFANLGMSGNLTQLIEAHATFGMQGMLSIQGSGVWKATPSGHKNQNETGLLDGWEQSLSSALIAAEPHLRSGALAGIFLGDERCCSGIPFTNVTAVADAVKSFLNRTAPNALVYINECSTPFDECQKANPSIACWGPTVPASIDAISLDIYHHAGCDNYANCSDPASEVETARAFVNAHVVPRMLPHQRLFIVPGTFGDWNESRSGPIASQQGGVVAKLNAYWEWAQSDPLIVGVNCWHWTTIPGLYKRNPGIIPFYYGVDAMPKVVARLNEIGAIIREEAAAAVAIGSTTLATASAQLAPKASSPWIDTSEGIHLFSLWGRGADGPQHGWGKAGRSRCEYVWGCDTPAALQAWRKQDASTVVSHYIPYARSWPDTASFAPLVCQK